MGVLIIGLTSTIWTASVFWDYCGAPGKWLISYPQPDALLSAAVEAPLLTQLLFFIWFFKWTVAVWAIKRGGTPRLWIPVHPSGPNNWGAGLGDRFRWTLLLLMGAVVVIPSTIALALQLQPAIRPVMNLAGAIVFLMGGVTKHPYDTAPHCYSDALRIIIPTTHHEGTVYQLPGLYRGFDAVWSPKILNEHAEADGEIMVLFQHMRSGRWMVSEPLERLRRTMARFKERVILHPEHARMLAAWIYADLDGTTTSFRSIVAARAPGVHLIGRDLMFALCHAEYLVFMSQSSLDEGTRKKLGRLRLVRRSGASIQKDDDEPDHTIGFRQGLEGYSEAVRHVYSIFDIPTELEALEFHVDPPSYSIALSTSPRSINEYASQLWDLSIENCESTFSALYFFSTVWFMELGNVNGFHILPIRCISTDGDLVAQHVMWRQLWYSACVAELVSVSPYLFGAYISGFFF